VDPRLRSLDDGVVRLGPRTLHLDITNTCNADCVTCWDHSPLLRDPPPASWKRQRMEVGRALAIVDDVVTLGGLEAVIVSGMGEPTTHPGFPDLVSGLKARGLHVTVITNGLALDQGVVLGRGVDQLLLGIHAASERTYLRFHPCLGPAHWEGLLRTLAALREAGRASKHVQVICALNAHELVGMVDLAHRFQAGQVNFKLAALGQGTQAVALDGAQRRVLAAEGIPAARAAARGLGVRHNLDLLAEQLAAGEGATAPVERVGCLVGYSYARVAADGTVLFCCDPGARVGSVADGSRFSDLWRGPRWEALRERMRRGRYLPGCRQCGKLNENVKLSRRFREALGECRWREVTGRGDP
jgi:MoaA/NifB/PqqE/SkfB family radical SAM enzyme